MAKGKNVKWQVEVNSTDELFSFTSQYVDNLLIMDVYNGMYGKCQAMVPCLKKLKAELDILQLAVVNCDDIEALRRFRGHSEPTFLFVHNGKVVNSFFGCNIPGMVQLIRDESKYFSETDDGRPIRRKYELNELTPRELEIRRAEKTEQIIKKRADAELARLKNIQHTEYVLEEVESHAEGSGVTIFMPHVITRDLYKKVQEVAENLRLSARERVTAIVTDEHLKMINYEKVNMPSVIFNHIKSKEVFMVCWKIPDDEERSAEDMLHDLKDAVTEKQMVKSSKTDVHEVAQEEEEGKGLSLKPLTILREQKCIAVCVESLVRLDSFNVELIEDDLEFIHYVIDFSIEYAAKNGADPGPLKQKLSQMLNIDEMDENYVIAMTILDKLIHDVIVEMVGDVSDEDDADATDEDEEASGEDEDELKEGDAASGEEEAAPEEAAAASGEGDAAPDAVSEEGAETASLLSENAEFYDPNDSSKMLIPPVWTPSDPKANAALIFLFFRVLTEHFLPPDPVPDPPHVAIVFSSKKWRDVYDAAKPYGNDVLAYGYFDSGDWQKAKLLASSHTEYKTLETAQPNDRLVLKVDTESDALLMLAGLLPDYVSQHEEDGKIECAGFFPEGYVNGEEAEGVEEVAEEEGEEGEEEKGEEGEEREEQEEGETPELSPETSPEAPTEASPDAPPQTPAEAPPE